MLQSSNHSDTLIETGVGRQFLVWPRNMDVKPLNRRAHAPYHFARPQGFAQQRDPAILRLADSAKHISCVGRLVGIQPALGKFAFQRVIGCPRGAPCSNPKSLPFEALEKTSQIL